MVDALYINEPKVNNLFSNFGVSLKKRVLPFVLAGNLALASASMINRTKLDVNSVIEDTKEIVDDLTSVSEYEARDIIFSNYDSILKYAKKYNISPLVLASCIYTEQVNNVDIFDTFDPELAKYCFLDTSIGVSQVKVSTAKLLEDKKYVQNNYYSLPYSCLLSKIEDNSRLVNNLSNPDKNIEYAAAYLSYLADVWEPYYPEIRNDSSILGTLYNLGHVKRGEGMLGYVFGIGNTPRIPHSNPKPNDFGCDVSDNISVVRNIMLTRNDSPVSETHEEKPIVMTKTNSISYAKCA